VLSLVLFAIRPPVEAQEGWPPALEHYSLRVGADEARGVETLVFDRFFGHGSARASVNFRGPAALGQGDTSDDQGTLFLRVWRRVPPGIVTFALLVFRVEIRGYDAQDTLVYARDLAHGDPDVPLFSFGDSASGHWSHGFRDLPATVARVDVTFFGNYE
jgi:hypothetical protein